MSNQQNVLDALLRADLPSFIAKCFATLDPGQTYHENWHVHHIAHQLTRVSAGEVKRLMINIPPRHLKSICVTVAYTAWLMGHNPSRKIITVSYGSELAEELAGHFRMIVESAWFQQAFPAFRIKSARRGKIATTENGFRLAVGIGGSILGRGADLIVIDDPMKASAAYSEAERRKVHEFYDNTLSTRLNNKREGAVIMIMQRLHEDDLCGHVLEREDWEQTVIPAIATEATDIQLGPRPGNVYRRKPGELIQPERDDEATLNQQCRILGSTSFEAQYQQNPVPPGGNAIRREWLRYYDVAPQLDLVMVSWDTASTIGAASDYSVGTVWGMKGADLYLLDVVRGRYEVPDLRRQVQRLHADHNASATVIEETELGRAITQEMRQTSGLRPIMIRPHFGKEARLLAQAPKFESGQVLLPRQASWLGAYISELLAFPAGKHDDQVDSTSQALLWLSQRLATSLPQRRPNPVRRPGARSVNTERR